MTEEKYIGDHGFKNNAPAYSGDTWGNVQLFLDTWGFLPDDDSVLDRLTKEQLIKLCIFSLDGACKIDLEGRNVKAIQDLMNDFGITPEALITKR